MNSEKKWTQGPWYTGHHDGDGKGHGCSDPLVVRPWRPEVSGGRPIAYAMRRCNDDEQADGPDADSFAWDIGKANARLIAQAPRLVEALEDFVTLGEQNEWDKRTTGRQVLMDNARKVLAAVYGESDERDT